MSQHGGSHQYNEELGKQVGSKGTSSFLSKAQDRAIGRKGNCQHRKHCPGSYSGQTSAIGGFRWHGASRERLEKIILAMEGL